MPTANSNVSQPGEHSTPLQHGGEQVREAVRDVREQAAEERQPRWRVVRQGRVVLAAYTVVVLIVVALALAAHSFSVLPGDLPFTLELQETTFPGLAGLMEFITFLGNPSQSAIILVIACAALVIFELPLEALFLFLTLLADGIGGLLKLVVGRHRPATDLVHVMQVIQTPSFPSGHTLHFAVFYGFLIFIVATNYKRSWQRDALIAVLAIPVLLGGLSRIYLGEHWLSDVVGGYLVGALCLVPLIAGYLWARAHVVITHQLPFVHRRVSTAE